MIFSFFMAFLFFALGNWILEKYFPKNGFAQKKTTSWSVGIIALFLLLCDISEILFYYLMGILLK